MLLPTRKYFVSFVCIAASFGWSAIAGAQAQGPTPPQVAPSESLSLRDAVEQAGRRYPAVRASVEEVSAAAAAIQQARTAFLPRADFYAQMNRATRNNVFGMILNQPFFSPISGPPLEETALTSVWGSLVGVLAQWEPFDFGRRQADVAIAESRRKTAEATRELTELEVRTAAADAFLTLLAAEQTVLAAEAGVKRSLVFEEMVGALVRSELRPGVDAERTRAELAVARIGVIQAQQAVDLAKASLSQFLGIPPSDVRVAASRNLLAEPDVPAHAAVFANHPLARRQSAAVDEIRAREFALQRSYFPRFNVMATTYGRGTGAAPDFTIRGGAAGLYPVIPNWGAGISMTFSAFDLPSIRAQRKVEAHRERAAAAEYDRVVQDLNGEAARAQARLEAARKIAEQAPVQLEAARAAERQATARYRAGLSTLTDVAETQRLLTQAEIDAALAALGIWRAYLGVAAARGDLEPFLDRAR